MLYRSFVVYSDIFLFPSHIQIIEKKIIILLLISAKRWRISITIRYDKKDDFFKINSNTDLLKKMRNPHCVMKIQCQVNNTFYYMKLPIIHEWFNHFVDKPRVRR